MVPEQRHREHARHRCHAQQHRPNHPHLRLRPLASMTEAMVEALWNLVQKHRKKNQPSQPVGNNEAGCDRDPSKNV